MNSRTRSPNGNPNPNPNRNPSPADPEFTDQNIQINGLEQVIDMLRFADPAFRASLLRRLQARDPALAQKLLRIIR